MVFHVEQARRVVGALDENPQPIEPIAVVAQQRAVARAVEIERGLFDVLEEARQGLAVQIPARAARRLEALELQPSVVDRGPCLHRQGGAHRAAVGARVLETVADRGRVGAIEGEKIDGVRLVELGVRGMERLVDADRVERAGPFHRRVVDPAPGQIFQA